MDVLGNNIANVNTTSFKSQSITFSDLMYQTTQTASGATETKGGVNARQIGLGAKSGAIATAIESQGATQTTNNPFDIMITGKSFFVVNNGKENLYTRDGSFYVDGAGNLAMQSNGYLVQGWVANENRETGEITINKNGGLSPLQIMSAANSTYSPASTTAGLFSGNIDDNDTNVTSDDGKTITLEFYDNKGYLYTGKFTLKDTGTDHLFALTLDNILDSNNESIGSDLLKEITFGDTTSTTRSVDNKPKGGYTFVVDSVTNTVEINADGGDVKYKNVPLSGKLSDLMSTSSKPYKGILNSTYQVTTADEANYTANAKYTIDAATGTLTITDTKSDVTDGTFAQASYNFSSGSGYYYVNSDLEAFRVPQSTSGSGSAFTEEYLTAPGGPFATTINKAGVTIANLVSDKYSYSFDTPTETITFKKTLSLAPTPATSQAAYAGSSLVTGTEPEAENFFNSSSARLDTAVANWINADPTNHKIDHLSYTYSGTPRVLSLYGKDLVDKTGGTSATLSSSGPTDEEITDFISEISSNDLKIADLNTIIDSTTASANAKAVAQALKTLVTDTMSAIGTSTPGYTGVIDNVEFSVAQLSGTRGIAITYPTKEYSDPVLLDTFSQEVTATSTLDSTYSRKQPSYVYNNITSANSYNKGYALSSTTGSFVGGGTNPYEKLLQTAFATDANVQAFLSNISTGTNYTINFNTTDGTVNIGHDVTETKAKESSYDVTDNGDGYVNYTSLQAYGDVPIKGNIADLLAAAKTDTAGLLTKIYGIDDENADAFGTDGTYEIITEAGESFGSIKLTTGDHTIQLKFNAANGALVSADGEKNGMVTMKFNQSVPGLEAFGFQAAAGNPDEAEKAGDVYIDFSAVTNYNTSGSSTIKAVKGDKKSLNTGRAVGEMNGVNISTDGQIFATYSNGQTKLLGQIASAEFANASGLSKNGDNLYSSTLNSGEATIQDITTDGGYMNTGVLEMSNVDLSREFTEMITTQRGFQANSRIITVSDTLLEELTNLKR
jgi:flagellar hook protein FlgE